VQYPPFFYVPDAAGYWLGRMFRMRVDATLALARCCNALAFAAISAWAIATARRTRPLLMAILMLPMSIALGASASQDAILLPTVAAVVATIDGLISDHRNATRRELVALAAAIATIGMARPPYATLCLLLPQAATPGTRLPRATWLAVASSAAAIVVWCGLMAAFTTEPIGGSDPIAQWHFLLADPGRIFCIAWHTLQQSRVYAWEFIGRLAWNDTPLPLAYRLVAWFVLAACASACMAGKTRRPALPAAAVVAAVAGIMVLQYFDWTPAGADHVEGVVGRYFIPLAMVLGLALPAVPQAAALRLKVAYGALAVFALVTPAIMLHHLALRFYIS
jgi:uncharacterized membrane protein